MGSGLILLVIVGAWLAVLVPMALRSHDTATSLTSVDKFSDAMRVLSRREERREERHAVVMPRRPALEVDLVAPLTVAERRRRTLLVLLGSALLSLGLSLFGVPIMGAVNALCDLLLVGFVAHLRRQAVLKAERAARLQSRRSPVAARVPVHQASRVSGIPERMPRRPDALGITLPAPAARYDDAAVAVDSSWSPVPVPPPTYVGKPVAPSRPPRVLDLTKPGEWAATLEDSGLDILDEGPELEDILERRRVSGGW
ncbi:MAG TPA: hypothetical protein VM097_09220 [Mycobacteriales bacterium]|nr:hypothetical protein [Mycobacteriales bacterium]